MAQSKEELFVLRDTLIFLLQNLGFVLNMRKSVLEPCQQIEFLGIVIDSTRMRVCLPEERIEKIKNHCRSLFQEKVVTVRDLAQLLGRLTASAIAVQPAPLHYRGI